MRKKPVRQNGLEKEKQARFPVPANIQTGGEVGIQNRAARASPRRLKPPRDSLKTAYRAVFLARIDLIGSNPHFSASLNAYRHGKPCLFFFFKPVLANGLFSYEMS